MLTTVEVPADFPLPAFVQAFAAGDVARVTGFFSRASIPAGAPVLQADRRWDTDLPNPVLPGPERPRHIPLIDMPGP